MKGRKRFIYLFLILFLEVSPFSWAQGPPPTPVVVSPVLERQVRESVVLVGTATPRVRSLFASEVEGLVKELYVDEGDAVKEGQILAKLGSSALEIQLEVAKAARNEAKDRYLQAKAELERSVKLRQSQSIAEKKFVDDQFEAMAWEKRVRQREAQISQLRDLLAKKTIIARFSGFVARKHTEVGQWVEQGGGIVTLIDLEYVHVVVQVPERYVGKIRVGDRASVSVEALGNKRFPGKIIAIIPEGDREARTFPVKVEIENENFRIKGGMLSRVTFSLGKPYPTMLVPKDALVNRDNQQFVFVYQNDIVKLIRLDVKGYHGDMAEVAGQLKPGLMVVIRGNERLRDGQNVLVIRDTSPRRE
ncbi:MAG: efflux RND transporter periplasmic adaptor subunit [Proteobacteria bacterium]|nr:efflux RND transporter periplasmic adaptor subunit [Pseudomonadota bacterium]